MSPDNAAAAAAETTVTPRGRMFLGRSPVVEGEENNLIDHEVVIADSQNSQAALFVCNEINSEVKNLRQEVAALKSTINDLQKKDEETRTNTSSSKLPKGLSVSIQNTK